MISTLPSFVEGVDWRELSPKEGNRRWRFELLRDLAFDIDIPPLAEPVEFRDKNGVAWASFIGRQFILHRRYRTNGASPKRWVPLLGWVGTPDCRGDATGIGGNILETFFHDGGRQFAGTQHMPLSLFEIDIAFYDLLRLAGFPAALPYFAAVRAFRGVWPAPDDGQHSAILP